MTWEAFHSTRRRPHLHEWTVSRYLLFDTPPSMLIFSCVFRQFVGSTDPRPVFLAQLFFEGRGGLSNLQIGPQSVGCAARTIILCTNFWPFGEEVLESRVFGNSLRASSATTFQLARTHLGNWRVHDGLFYSLAKGRPLGKDEKKRG